MALIDEWQNRHPRKSGKGLLIMYIFLLIMILFLILKADTFLQGFINIFFSSDSASVVQENSP